jgi:hypothetical protein
MGTGQAVELILTLAALVSPALHLAGLAAQPWARALLSLLPDIIGMVRRAQGKAGAPGAPNIGQEEP